MRVIVCGSRTWIDYDTIHRRLSSLPKDTIIITGGALGADSIATAIARELGLKCVEVPADMVRELKHQLTEYGPYNEWVQWLASNIGVELIEHYSIVSADGYVKYRTRMLHACEDLDVESDCPIACSPV